MLKENLKRVINKIESSSEDIGYYSDGSDLKQQAYAHRRNAYAELEKLLDEVKKLEDSK